MPLAMSSAEGGISEHSHPVCIAKTLLFTHIFFATDFPEKLFDRLRSRFSGVVVAFVIFWWSVYYLAIGINNPFLYFRY